MAGWHLIFDHTNRELHCFCLFLGDRNEKQNKISYCYLIWLSRTNRLKINIEYVMLLVIRVVS